MVEKGYDFVWRHGEVPYLIHPDDKRHVQLAVQDFCPYLEITGGESPPPPPTRRKSKAKASAAATHSRTDFVLNVEAKEFYPAGQVKSGDAEKRNHMERGPAGSHKKDTATPLLQPRQPSRRTALPKQG